MANASPRGGREGELLGPYRLVRKLGRGGMGEVWLAEHETIKSQVAIKLVLAAPDDEDAAARFLREAKATARIRHPGVVNVTDFGPRPAGGAYLVMELLDGESLGERLDRGAVSIDLAIDLGVQIAEALAAAHLSGVVHRDLKPANIFLVRDAATRGGVRVKLVDFGVAKATGKVTDELGATVTGALVGTPVYMAPEQCTTRKGPVDHRADLYALGVVLYEMTTGKPPFRGPTLGDLIDQHINETPTSPRITTPEIPAKLDVLIMTLLAKDRADRPASANDVARDLHGLRGTPPSPSLDATMVSGARPRDVSVDVTVDSGSAPAARAIRASSRDTPEGSAAPPAIVARAGSIVRTRLMIGIGALLAVVAIVIVIVKSRSTPERDLSTLSRAEVAASCSGGAVPACKELARRELSRTEPAPDFVALSHALLRMCDAKDFDGCAQLAQLAISGLGIPSDYGRARALATSSCDGGSARGCAILGDILANGIGMDVDGAGGLARRTRGCELGSATACHEASRSLRFGLAVPVDTAAADRLMALSITTSEASCARGDLDGCRVRGLIYALGDGTSEDPVRAPPLFERACLGGIAAACGDLGNMYFAALGVSRDMDRGVALIERGCRAGDDNSCIGWIGLLARGMVGKADPERALTLATTACRDRGDRMCQALGDLYNGGSGVTRDRERASELYARACRGGIGDGCMLAALLPTSAGERTKDEVTQLRTRGCDLGAFLSCTALGTAIKDTDPHRALVLFERGCQLSGRSWGCEEVANAYLEGRGVPLDVERGQKELERACAAGATKACRDLAGRLRDGRVLGKNPQRAIELLEKACVVGDARACRDAGRMLRGGLGIAADPGRAASHEARMCTLEPSLCPPGAKAEPNRDSSPTPVK